MLRTIAEVLPILRTLGLFAGVTMSGFIHGLPAIAIGSVLLRVITCKRLVMRIAPGRANF